MEEVVEVVLKEVEEGRRAWPPGEPVEVIPQELVVGRARVHQPWGGVRRAPMATLAMVRMTMMSCLLPLAMTVAVWQMETRTASLVCFRIRGSVLSFLGRG